MRVVVVDGSDPVRARLVAHLREAGVALVMDVSSLAKARSVIADFGPEAIVADVVYPDCRSVDVVGALRALAPGVRLFILTNEVHIRTRCLDEGAHGFFDKSKELDLLVATLLRTN